MAKLHISHHERVEGHPHRWHVFFHGRDVDHSKYNDLKIGDVVTFEMIEDRIFPKAFPMDHIV